MVLNRQCHACSAGLVADLMNELDLREVQPRSYRATTIHDNQHPDIKDGINRSFTSRQPRTRLLGDITCFRIDQGRLYVAVLLGLTTRMVISWQIARHIRTSLITDALEMARLHGRIKAGAIFHSVRGGQDASGKFAKYLRRSRIIPSMGRSGVCWGNPAAESFFATLKNEMYYRHRFTTQTKALFAVAE